MEDRPTEPRDLYVETVVDALTNVGDWIAIDSWLGGGKVHDTSPNAGSDPQTYPAFRAVSSVVAMAVELADTALQASRRDRYYAVAAITRQLIECEYLLVLFEEDLEEARIWVSSSPEEIRKSFAPAKMRKRLKRFSNDEYWRHCSIGGHPAPKGIHLLERSDPRRSVWRVMRVEVAMDLGLHIRRIWVAIDSVLAKHHVRYARVRAAQRRSAEDAWKQWINDDELVAAFTGLPREEPDEHEDDDIVDASRAATTDS